MQPSRSPVPFVGGYRGATHCAAARRYNRAMHAPKACDVFCKLHAMHYSKSMIGPLTGYSSAYVGMVLSELGHTERWHKPDDCRAALPQALRKSCDHLRSARAAQPIDPRTALAIARRLELRALIERSETSG
jgi:hypothetical protein